MQFLKKHYEKILLCTVLALLAAAAVWLSILAKDEQHNIDVATQAILESPPSPVQPLDFTKYQTALKKVMDPPVLDLAVSNHVFNPVKWIQTPPPDEKLIPLRTGDEVTGSMEIRKRTPLTLTISYDGTSGAGETLKYSVSILDQGRRSIRPTTTLVAPGDKPNRLFTLKEAKGAGNDVELTIELKDEAEAISVSKGKPYTRTVGYVVDLFYKLENKQFLNKRTGDQVDFGSDSYKIVAISDKEVVLESNTSGKRYTVKDKSP